ncbi:MAG: hypothetical protein AAGF12_04475 [Myxococcota bacterium]
MSSSPHPSSLERGSAPKRYRGRIVAPVLVLVILGAIAFAMFRFFSTQWPTGDAQGVVAVSDERAIIVRESDNDAFTIEMVLVDREDGPQWRKGVYQLQLAPPAGIVVAGEHVLVRAQDLEGHLETHGFLLTTGEFDWRSRAYPTVPEGWEAGAETVLVDGRVIETYGGPEGSIRILDPATGDVIASEAAPFGDELRIVRGGNEVLVSDGEHSYQVVGGEIHPYAVPAASILGPGGALFEENDRWVLREGTARLSLVDAPVGTPRAWLRSGDRLVIFSNEAMNVYDEAGTRRFAFQPDAGTLHAPRGEADGGFLPVADSEGTLRVIDLRTGGVGEELELGPDAQVVLAEISAIASSTRGLAAVDLTTGEVTAQAKVLESDSDLFPVVISHVVGDRLWIGDPADARLVDATTLRPLRSWAVRPRFAGSSL